MRISVLIILRYKECYLKRPCQHATINGRNVESMEVYETEESLSVTLGKAVHCNSTRKSLDCIQRDEAKGIR